MLMMRVWFGTYNPDSVMLDLDDYGDRKIIYYPKDYRKQAYELLLKTLDDGNFADDGNRNTNAVNSLIALHVLGYDAESWMKKFIDKLEEMKRPSDSKDMFWTRDLNKFRKHVERVLPYLEKWGPEGREYEALDYAIG